MISLSSIGQLIGGVGLFLLGMQLMTDGLKVAAGRSLKRLLKQWTGSHIRGLFAGVALTALVQSSSAVTVATIGFVNAGMLSLERSVWVIFGSNIGTTMTGWLVALIGFKIKIELFAFPIVGIGMIMKLTGQDTRRDAFGQAIVGFGLFFIGIAVLKEAFQGVAQTFDIGTLYTSGALGILLFVGIGFVMTVLTQSSSASISIALAAAAGHMITIEPAAAMVIGANVGTTSTALIAVIGATPNAKRVAASHVVFNILTGAVAVVILPIMLSMVRVLQEDLHLTPDIATSLALFHTVFNVLGVALIWGIAGPMIAWLKKRFVNLEEDLSRPRFLDKNALIVPALALESLIMELSRLQEISISIVITALSPLPANRSELRRRLNVVEILSRHIGDYARKMYQAQLPPSVSSALMHPYRALQHFEEIARIGADLPKWRAERPALHEREEHLLEVYITTLSDELKLMTSPEPVPETWVPKKARSAIHEAYSKLKESLLAAGARGELSFHALEKTSFFIDHAHACGVRAIKAERRLRLIRNATLDVNAPEAEEKRTDDG